MIYDQNNFVLAAEEGEQDSSINKEVKGEKKDGGKI
jgi:hypothetical protein